MEDASDDREAIRQCLSESKGAFQILVKKYQAEAFAHALAIVASREDAADAVQEAFCDAFTGLRRFDASRAFYPWFYVILRNRCFQLLRAKNRRPDRKAKSSERMELIASPMRVDVAGLEEALWSLSAEDREIITLKHFDGLSYAELAERLEIPQGTVMSRLYHARGRLRKLLVETKDDDREVSHERT